MTPADEAIAPLDAYATAKPDEPVFTLQGGDPLAAPLVRIWAHLARIRAGVFGRISVEMLDVVKTAAIEHLVEHDERERDNLLVRATAAEEVSWDMDAYLSGHASQAAEEPREGDDPDVLARIDLHDYRVRSAQKINNMVAELQNMLDDLVSRWDDKPDSAEDMLRQTKARLELISHWIEPRRLMKREPIHHAGQ